MIVIAVVIVIISLLALLYKYATSTFGYWEKLGVVGPTPQILVGNFPSSINQKRNVAYEVDEIYR